MTWIIDASVAIKWFVDEERSAAARAVLETGEPLAAPDLIVSEVCNIAWKKARRDEISWTHGAALVQALPLSFDRLAPAGPLAARAFALAQRFGHPAYDCFYLALAEFENTRLVTDDGELVRLARAARLGKHVKPLADFARSRK